MTGILLCKKLIKFINQCHEEKNLKLVICYLMAGSNLLVFQSARFKTELEYFYDLIFRKIAHMAEYFVLAFLFYKALGNYKLSYRKVLIFSFILTVLSAILDEFHQSFVAGRSASAFDVIIDTVGAIILIIFLLKNRFNSLFSKQPL